MSVRHDSMTCFTSRGRQRRSKGSIRRCGPRGRKPRTQRGLRDGYQVRPDPVTRAECIKVSRGVGIPERTVTYVKEVISILGDTTVDVSRVTKYNLEVIFIKVIFSKTAVKLVMFGMGVNKLMM